MAEVILAEQTLDGFVFDENEGASLYNVNPAPFVLELGITYEVVWDGTSYECAAQDMSAFGEGYLGLGNLASVGATGNNEPFAIGWSEVGVSYMAFDEVTSHTIAIHTVDETSGISIVLYDRTGQAILKEGVETLTTDTPVEGETALFTYGEAIENAEYELSMAEGNQKVTLDEGRLLKEFTLIKPANLLPEYIKKGIDIAGVTGNFAGDVAEKTVELNMAEGDQVIEADEDTVLTKVTVLKPDTLLSENIVKDVDIGGVVGTFEGNGNLIVDEDWLEDVCFWDLDGTLLYRMSVEEACTLTELPVPPEHEGLTFQGWNFTLEEIKAANHILDIGAMYVPSDGNTHFKLNITNSSYLKIYFNFTVSIADGYIIDWGDGTTTTSSSAGTMSLTHTYASVGEYEIVLTVNDGATVTLGQGASSTGLFGNSSGYRDNVKEIYIGNNIEFAEYAFGSCTSLEILTFNPSGVTNFPKNMLYANYNIKALLIPNTATTLADNAFYNCISSDSPYICEPISIPNSIETFGNYSISGHKCFRLVLPDSMLEVPARICYNNRFTKKVYFNDQITSIGDYAFYQTRIREFTIPNTVTTIGQNVFNYTSIEKLSFPEGLTELPNYSIYYMYCLKKIIIPESLVTIGNYSIYYCYALRQIIIKSPISSVGTSFFNNVKSVEEIVFTQIEPPSKLTSFMGSDTYYTKFYVPDESIEAYRSAATSYAKQNIYPLSEFKGSLD